MRKSNAIGAAMFVLAGLAFFLTVDPFDFLVDDVPDAVETELEGDNRTTVGLQGRAPRVLPDADPKEWDGDPVGRLVLTLGRATLTGAVTGEGQPLRFARVRLGLPPPNDQMAVRTRKDGTYEIAGLPDGSHDVRASMEGYVGRTVTAPPVAVDQTAIVETIDLTTRKDNTNAILVKVTDAFDRPLPGVRVLVTTMPWDLHLSMGPELSGIGGVVHKQGTTDDNGRVRLGPLPPENYGVVAMLSGYINAGVNSLPLTEGRTRSVGLRLIKGVAIQGRVTTMSGEGIAGATILGFAMPNFVASAPVQSAEDGTFVLDGLRKGQYMVVAASTKDGSVMVPGKSPGRLDVKLPGTGVIKGKVVWDDGKPVTDGQVRPFKIGPFEYVYSMVHKVDADGGFSFDVPKGDWICRVQAADGTMYDGEAVKVEVGDTTTVEIKIAKSRVARGVVMDENGNHIEGAEVFLMQGGFPATPSREQYARTDTEGRFEVKGLGADQVDLHVTHSEYADTKVSFTPQFADAATEQSVRLKAGAIVRGTVTDAAGTPVAGEQVNLTVEGGWFDARSTFTDEAGTYRFTAVTPGTYLATTGPFEQGARGLSKSGIKVGETGEVTVDFQSAAAAGKLTGTVTMAGKPVPRAQVTLVDARGPEGAVGVVADEAGRFAAEGLQYGRVRVTAKTGSGLTGAAETTVAPGDTVADISVDIGSCTVRVRVLDPTGEPAPGCWINVESTEGDQTGWSRVKDNGNSDVNGVYQSKGVQPGTYVIRVNKVEYAQFRSAPFTLAEGEAKDLGDVRLSAGVLLQGIVTNDAGAPIEEVTVSLKDMQGRAIQLFSMATTGSDGRYAMHSVKPGDYVAHFQANGHALGTEEVTITDAGGTASVVLTRGGSVQVVVKGPDGSPISGANVKLFDEKGVQVTRTISLANFDTGRRYSDAEGRASLADLAAGTYLVRAEKAGWTLVGSAPRVRVEPGGAASATLTLEPAE